MRERTVILTRQSEDVSALRTELEARGCRILDVPCIRTEPLEDRRALDAGLDALDRDDVLVITSRAGVVAVTHGGRSIRSGVAVIGPATAERARMAGLHVIFTPSHADPAVFARELPLPSGTLVLARSDIADGELPEMLRHRGARVRELVAYRTILDAQGDLVLARAALEGSGVTIGFASPSAVRALSAAIGHQLLRGATIVAIGPRTGREVRAVIGVEPIVAPTTDAAALANVLAPTYQEVAT